MSKSYHYKIFFSKLGCVNAYVGGDLQCNSWKDGGYCSNSEYKDWMTTNCMKACNLCEGKSYSFCINKTFERTDFPWRVVQIQR